MLLSQQVIAGILFIAGLAFSIRSYLYFTEEASVLKPKITKADNDLAYIRDGMADQKDQVESLTKEIAPLATQEAAMQKHLNLLKQNKIEDEQTSNKRKKRTFD